jgi:hypothetical protein
LVNGGIVGGLDADEQRLGNERRVEIAQDALQDAGRDLAASAPAMREPGEANRRAFGGVHAQRSTAATGAMRNGRRLGAF